MSDSFIAGSMAFRSAGPDGEKSLDDLGEVLNDTLWGFSRGFKSIDKISGRGHWKSSGEEKMKVRVFKPNVLFLL